MRGPALLLLITLALFASSCGSSPDDQATEADPTAAPTAEPELEATASPLPTATSAPVAAEPTVVPEPTVAAEPTEAPEPDPTAVPEAAIYDAPGSLEVPIPLPPGAPGTLIDTEELVISGAVGHRILYHSTSTRGDDIAVSGFVAYPNGDTPDGGWPLIAWAHGTTGLADACAPSHNAESDQLALALVGFGYAVVATDYEGLGTPGLHPYVVGPSEAHSVLDSVRAVNEFDLPVTDEWIVFGHSQGGHAAMFTGQLQPTYAPELNMIGVVAGAPPSQQSELGDSLVGGDFQGYLVMTAAGLVAAYDTLDLSDILLPEALDLIDVVDQGCTSEIFDAFNDLTYADVAVEDPFALPAWNDALLANDTNQLPVHAPLLIIHGGEDEQIPVETSAKLFAQLCAYEDQGPTVRNVYEGQSHAGVLTTFAAVPDLLTWVQGRFAGEPAPDGCA